MTATETVPARAGTPTLGAITHAALTVRDLKVSVPWYARLVGAEPVLDEDTGPFRHAVFVLNGTMLGLHQFGSGVDESAPDPRRLGMDHIAFGVADRAELAAWARRLDELGIVRGAIVDAHYGSGLAFKDPDGIPLELFAPPGT
ncbi:VOC family protein [Petropleomorpha daqingensis]|uniref:Catechol 2,3-dioxygenase-like lactoylglutathione lyase family enzyme n=1 Tax=Petropleomorpha daqingensis TaxID=2026353 RepID=A0A853CLU7_9ACTN|nr:VOC family protein [Petropleomorpha daqingensis]NYJ08396.1 catechol 2,3-dioxygenase-like lactoylglutathione lyase family enzyme [Petropleomorpha daqingensis]